MISPQKSLRTCNIYIFCTSISHNFSWNSFRNLEIIKIKHLTIKHVCYIHLCNHVCMYFKAIGFNLSYPSKCQIQFGPGLSYNPCLNVPLLLVLTPVWPRCFMICATITRDTIRLFLIQLWCIAL